MEPTICKFSGNRCYSKISNQLLQNNKLSWKARGLLAYILSLPDNWEIHVSFLVDQSPNGKESVQSAIKELSALGYMSIETIRDAQTGRVTGKRWMAFDDPADNTKRPQLFSTELRQPGNPAIGTDNRVSPPTVKPEDGKPAAIKEIEEEKKLIPTKPDAVAPVQDDVPDELALKPVEPPKPKARDLIWDALCAFQGYSLTEKLNRTAAGKIARCKKLILESMPDVTPAEIHDRGQACRQAWQGNDVMKLATDWSRWGSGGTQPAQKWKYPNLGRDTLSPIL